MGVMRQVRILAMRGYEKRMKQIMAICFERDINMEKHHAPGSYEEELIEEYRKMQKSYLELAAINKKEFEDAR